MMTLLIIEDMENMLVVGPDVLWYGFMHSIFNQLNFVPTPNVTFYSNFKQGYMRSYNLPPLRNVIFSWRYS